MFSNVLFIAQTEVNSKLFLLHKLKSTRFSKRCNVLRNEAIVFILLATVFICGFINASILLVLDCLKRQINWTLKDNN